MIILEFNTYLYNFCYVKNCIIFFLFYLCCHFQLSVEITCCHLRDPARNLLCIVTRELFYNNVKFYTNDIVVISTIRTHMCAHKHINTLRI